MQWDDLKYFIALARAGTLSAAARKMGAEHTTIARRVASLEAGLGMRLFDRSSGGFVLTAEAARIAELAARIERDAFEIERTAQGGKSDLEGQVRISAPPAFAGAFLAARLVALRAAHPGLDIELVGDSRSVSLSRREADIAIRLNPPEGASIVARRVGTLAFGLYGERSYVERTPDSERHFIGYDESLDHVPQQRWLRSVFGAQRLVFRSNELATLHQAAAAGMGLAVLPRFMGDADPRLVMVPAEPPPSGRELWLLIHPDLRRSPRFRAVFDFLVAALATGHVALNP
ncbi:MAG TPA: LysR family transcriptional regulator [Sphingomonas sp.]|nr:LysR family transcriptional regulator [Sphingomonas sp.]